MRKFGCYAMILFLLAACAEKVVKCALVGETMNVQKLPSIVTINKNLLIADTTVVSVSGKILGSYIHERKDTITDPLEFTNVIFTNIKTKKVVGTVTEKDGSYNLIIPAAAYKIEVQYIGYNTVVIKNIQLGTGEVINFSVNLGQGIGEENFKIKRTRTTRKIVQETSN